MKYSTMISVKENTFGILKNEKEISFLTLTLGKAYIAPWTVWHVNPSIELNVSATSFALSAKDLRVPSFCAMKLAYDGSPGFGGFTTTSIHA